MSTSVQEYSAPVAGATASPVQGEFVDHDGERYYAIRHVDKMPPFFISVVSHSDHWLFISSNGGLTAGRVSPDSALFPYASVDKIQDSISHTGSKTIVQVQQGGHLETWEPFGAVVQQTIQRNLYKNTLGNKLCFEEINESLQLIFRYTWSSSDSYGFVRACSLQNTADKKIQATLLDGVQNILPAGAPRDVQTTASNLVDAYKWSELDAESGVAFYTLFSGITDKPEPLESLRANTVFHYGLDQPEILLSSDQVEAFRQGQGVYQETQSRGKRGAYFVSASLQIAAGESQQWGLVADVARSQRQVSTLCHEVQTSSDMQAEIAASVAEGSEGLRCIMAGMDGFQAAAEESVAVHHYANVLFNGMRGGVFDNQYWIDCQDFRNSVLHFNQTVYQSCEAFLTSLPDSIVFAELLSAVQAQENVALERLCYEYLPLTFGRRHGDPSRPWNQFAIKLKDEYDNRLLSYQGNWRDIFQNWEALVFSHPEFIENTIAKFVNASTVDGYNPYRVTKEGIDWEIEDPEDPWSYIGYWGDHQIIYLLKLLELSNNFHPDRLASLLRHPVFCYANVPYRIQPFEALLENPKDTVHYDADLEAKIAQRVKSLGADGKLLLDAKGEVYQVNLAEKLLVPLLSKLGNFVPEGGVWLNTQRPEWNDANNALVGQGLSMVTLYYLRRYVQFLQQLLQTQTKPFACSSEVAQWLQETALILQESCKQLAEGRLSPKKKFMVFSQLGQAASTYRTTVYQQEGFSGSTEQAITPVQALLADALIVIDDSLRANQREDGLYHAYNLLNTHDDTLKIDHLYPMLEGQVAVLSSGAVDAKQAVEILAHLFTTDLFREDQQSFMLYPDRQLPGFLEKNLLSADQAQQVPLLAHMLEVKDECILVADRDGYRFRASLSSRAALKAQLEGQVGTYGALVEESRVALLALYEKTFNHKEFTGRSGGMFGFEGLGCIYWHMVSKLLLAVQEVFFVACDKGAAGTEREALAYWYYQVRQGIGFNKTPAAYGAFPTDPYSHTPKHAGAQQPGMTGQVKEEVLSRFGELGVRVNAGVLSFQPQLLRRREFLAQASSFNYLDTENQWQEIAVPAQALAFSWCQVPIVYRLQESDIATISIHKKDGTTEVIQGLDLSAAWSKDLFLRAGTIQQLTVRIHSELLCADLAQEV